MLVSAQNGNNINNLFNTVIDNYLGPEFQPKAQEMIDQKSDICSTKLKGNKNIHAKKENNCNC